MLTNGANVVDSNPPLETAKVAEDLTCLGATSGVYCLRFVIDGSRVMRYEVPLQRSPSEARCAMPLVVSAQWRPNRLGSLIVTRVISIKHPS